MSSRAIAPKRTREMLNRNALRRPSNKATPVDPRVPDFKKIKFIDYDYAKYGASAERRRLIAKWEKDVNSLPR